jgi:hypothetical protein
MSCQELTKAINTKNEAAAAGRAEQAGGGKLSVVKAPPTDPKDERPHGKKKSVD